MSQTDKRTDDLQLTSLVPTAAAWLTIFSIFPVLTAGFTQAANLQD